MAASGKLFVILVFACIALSYSAPAGFELEGVENLAQLQRQRRQFDFTLSAEHDDQEEETEIALEAIANLWRSPDSKTQVEGSAKVVHRVNQMETGNTKFSGKLHVHHDYKRK